MLNRHRGQLALGLAACSAAGLIYVLERQRRRRRGSKAASPGIPVMPVVLDHKFYGLSNHGFVPEAHDVLHCLPAAYDAWEATIARLPHLVQSREIRAVVQSWPKIAVEELDDGSSFSPALRRAYSILAMIAHAYIWCDESAPLEVLPSQLAVPLHAVATTLGLHPVLTHSAVDLWNWTRTGAVDTPCKLNSQDDLRCLNTMTGTRDEEWFYCSSTVCQSLAGPIVLAAYQVLAQAVPARDACAVEDFLTKCSACFEGMANTLKRLPEHCTPEVFYGKMRHLLQGFGTGTNLPQGLLYEGVAEYRGLKQTFGGASAAQSSAIPVLDAVLGVVHTESAAFMQDMQRYMPSKHRQFLELIQAQQPLRTVLLQWRACGVDADVEALAKTFNSCLDQLANFRRGHWRLVGSHILSPKAALAARSAGCCGGQDSSNGATRGTGGSPLEVFLRSTVDATLAAKI